MGISTGAYTVGIGIGTGINIGILRCRSGVDTRMSKGTSIVVCT